jgi:hypothetical protein
MPAASTLVRDQLWDIQKNIPYRQHNLAYKEMLAFLAISLNKPGPSSNQQTPQANAQGQVPVDAAELTKRFRSARKFYDATGDLHLLRRVGGFLLA